MTIPHVPYGAQRVDPTPSAPPARLAEVGLGMAVPSFSAAPAAATLAAQAAPVAPPSAPAHPTPAAPAHPEPATPVEPHPAPQVEVHPEPVHHPEPTSSAAPAHPEPAATSTPAPAAAGGGNPPPPVTPTPAAVAAPEPQPAPVLATVQGEPLSPIASVAARQRAAAAAETPQATPPAQRAAVPSDRWMLLKVGMIVLAVIAGFGLGFYVFWPKGQQAVIPVNPTPVVVHPPAPAQLPPVIIHNYPVPAATPAPAQPQTPSLGNAGGGGSTISPPGEPVDGDGPKVKVDEPAWLIRN